MTNPTIARYPSVGDGRDGVGMWVGRWVGKEGWKLIRRELGKQTAPPNNKKERTGQHKGRKVVGPVDEDGQEQGLVPPLLVVQGRGKPLLGQAGAHDERRGAVQGHRGERPH